MTNKEQFWQIYEDAMWVCEKIAGRIWVALSFGRVSFWLDFLPAFFCRERYRGQNNKITVGRKENES